MKPVPPSRILVVNNHQASAKELATQLRKVGHEVEVASDMASALRLETTFSPDIVIIDLGLSGMDACTVARLLRAQTNRDVMLVADGGSLDDHARANEGGCFDHHVSRIHGIPFLPSLGMKLAEQSVEDWMFSPSARVDSKGYYVLQMLEAASGRFEPAELAPLMPEELLREVRRVAESATDLEDCLAQSEYPFISADCGYRAVIFEGAARWFRFFNP